MFKYGLLTLVLAGICYTGALSAAAQDSGANDQQPPAASTPPARGQGHFDPARRTEMLTKHLRLTSDQQSKVQDILTSEKSQMESLRSDASVSPQDRRPKMMEIHKASADQIRSLLDSNQQKKWDAMQSRREQRQGHPPTGQAPPTPDSPDQQ
jgi:periplasmic protein CpxP/Spy